MTTITGTGSKLSLHEDGLTFTFLESGDLYQAVGGTMMINQLLSNSVDGAPGNLYARLHLQDGIQAFPLLGVKSSSRFRQDGKRLVWQGEITAGPDVPGLLTDIRYQVLFTLSSRGVWFWDVKVEGSNVLLDVIYSQDVGIASLQLSPVMKPIYRNILIMRYLRMRSMDMWSAPGKISRKAASSRTCSKVLSPELPGIPPMASSSSDYPTRKPTNRKHCTRNSWPMRFINMNLPIQR